MIEKVQCTLKFRVAKCLLHLVRTARCGSVDTRGALSPVCDMWTNIGSSQTLPNKSNVRGFDTAPTPKSKRRKIEIACDTCRLRKSRCDGGRPSMLNTHDIDFTPS